MGTALLVSEDLSLIGTWERLNHSGRFFLGFSVSGQFSGAEIPDMLSFSTLVPFPVFILLYSFTPTRNVQRVSVAPFALAKW